jgi:Response regulator containing a CheY-like receiver domain and an HTH DNA-binding domain
MGAIPSREHVCHERLCVLLMSIVLLVASTDEHFREMIRENLGNIPNSKVVAEYQEVAQNLYIRVLQDLARNPHAALILDLAGDPETSLKALEKVKQAAPDLYVMVSNYHADGETVIGALRSGANDFLMQPLKRTEFRDAITRSSARRGTPLPARASSAKSTRLSEPRAAWAQLRSRSTLRPCWLRES